jgi:hypothetical protein
MDAQGHVASARPHRPELISSLAPVLAQGAAEACSGGVLQAGSRQWLASVGVAEGGPGAQ